MTEPRPPEGVRLIIGSQVIPCDVARDPAKDTATSVAWAATPVEPVTAVVFPGMNVQLYAGLLPAHASLHINLAIPPPQCLS